MEAAQSLGGAAQSLLGGGAQSLLGGGAQSLVGGAQSAEGGGGAEPPTCITELGRLGRKESSGLLFADHVYLGWGLGLCIGPTMGWPAV